MVTMTTTTTTITDKKGVFADEQKASHQYSNGQTRIRDMVSFAREAIGANVKNNPDAQKRIMGNILALERINESRSRFWRTIHPFRNKAEQRDTFWKKSILSSALSSAS